MEFFLGRIIQLEAVLPKGKIAHEFHFHNPPTCLVSDMGLTLAVETVFPDAFLLYIVLSILYISKDRHRSDASGFPAQLR